MDKTIVPLSVCSVCKLGPCAYGKGMVAPRVEFNSCVVEKVEPVFSGEFNDARPAPNGSFDTRFPH